MLTIQAKNITQKPLKIRKVELLQASVLLDAEEAQNYGSKIKIKVWQKLYAMINSSTKYL